MFCRFADQFSLGFNGTTELADGELVSGTYFPVLGVGAAIGRTFTPDDDRIPGGHPLAMLSYAYWQSRFAGDPSVVGKTLTVNGHNFTIVGVAQKGFQGVDLGHASLVFVPIMMRPQLKPLFNESLDFHNRRTRWVNAFGRLKPGISRQQAQASLAALLPRHAGDGSEGKGFQQGDRGSAGAIPPERDRGAAGRRRESRASANCWRRRCGY
jgi:hypothetical protein